MPPQTRLEPVLLEDRRIIFRNFSGAEGQFNPKGKRKFSVLLAKEEAEKMARDGWNVKYLKPREEGDEPQPRLEVTVKYSEKAKPPRVILITSRGKTQLDESMISLLDWAEIEKVDLIIRPYHWDIQNKIGITAYLKAIYVTIHEDELELKYQDVPDSAISSLPITTQEEEAPF